MQHAMFLCKWQHDRFRHLVQIQSLQVGKEMTVGIGGDMSGILIRPRKSGEIIPCNFKLHGLHGLTTGKQAHKLHKIACR